MQSKFLIVVFFILCSHVLSSSFTSKLEGFNLSKLQEGNQLRDLNEMIKMKEEGGEYKELKYFNKNQRGRGANGGDVASHPRQNVYSSASSLLAQLSSPISLKMLPVSIGLLHAFLYLF